MTRIPKVRISRICLRRAPVALAALVALGLGLVAIPSAKAQTLTVLHSFAGNGDGIQPMAPLIMDEAGNLYGTTYYGGINGRGVVFKVHTSGRETVLYSFPAYPGDGANPNAGVIMDKAGNLYGTTFYGGENEILFGGEPENGTVFKLDTSGNETLPHSFTGGPGDGSNPYAGLIMDKAGNLYGTTPNGGAFWEGPETPEGPGAVFKLDTSGSEMLLYSFGGPNGVDAGVPLAGVIMDKAGNLYGTTTLGGDFGEGTVFKLDTSGNATVPYSFPDGAGPIYAGLFMDRAGNLYGTTTHGGAFGEGTVFKLDPSGKGTVLHSFAGPPGDGAFPWAAPIVDERGNLYGTTYAGGTGTCNFDGPGCGTVYEIDRYGNETVLHSFAGSPDDGAAPVAGLVTDKAGNLYGTTEAGGAASWGTVFKLSPPSPQQATQTIIDAVNALYSQGVLSGAEYNGLVQRLQKAILLMNAGRDGDADQSLRAFIREVLGLQRSGVLSPSQAEPLISAAEAVIAQLS